MKNLYLSIAFMLALLLFSAVLIADDTVKSGKLDMSERIFDFGMVPREAKVMHTFILKNIGNDTIHITDIKPGCSCTAAPIDKKVIAVNDQAVMPVTYKTGKSSGKSSKGVKITTDMRPRGLYPLQIDAYIESPTARPPKFYAEPRSIEFIPSPDALAGNAKALIYNMNKTEVALKIVDYTSDLGTATLSANKIKAGQNIELDFAFIENANYKPLNGSVTMEVYLDEQEVLRYTVPVIRATPVNK